MKRYILIGFGITIFHICIWLWGFAHVPGAAAPAPAAHTLTFTINTRQELAVTRARERFNAGNPSGAIATNDAFLQAVLNREIVSMVQEHKELTGAALREAYENANGATQSQVNTLLGVSP
jgi:hypothetical protein